MQNPATSPPSTKCAGFARCGASSWSHQPSRCGERAVTGSSRRETRAEGMSERNFVGFASQRPHRRSRSSSARGTERRIARLTVAIISLLAAGCGDSHCSTSDELTTSFTVKDPQNLVTIKTEGACGEATCETKAAKTCEVWGVTLSNQTGASCTITLVYADPAANETFKATVYKDQCGHLRVG